LPAAQASLIKWRIDYNGSRPHSQLDWQTPNEFASTFTPRRATALRNMESSATLPVSSTADQGKTNAGNELNAG
jgi:putative transposase